VTPVADRLVGVAILTSERGSFESHLAAFPALRQRLREATVATPVLGAGPLRQRAHRRVSGRVLLVGDSAGYVDALTGEGIAVALRTSAELVRCVAADQPDAYERAWQRGLAGVPVAHRVVAVGPQSAGAGSADRACGPRLPAVFGAIVNRLA
jgi:flavin-dependent dehydrogenase